MNPTLQFRKKKFTIALLLFFILSITFYFYKDYYPLSFVTGSIQKLFAGPKSTLYALGKDESQIQSKAVMMESKMVDYQLLKQDNLALKSQFETSGETSTSLIASKIIGFKGAGHRPLELVINVGENHGILKGMSVVYKNYFIGKIDLVSKNYSVVITPFNPILRVLAKVPETNANGIIVGRNDFLLLDGVIITDDIKKDHLVVTKGEVGRDGVGIVPDLIIGKIVSVSKRESAPFQGAQVEPSIDYSRLTSVFVIAKM